MDRVTGPAAYRLVRQRLAAVLRSAPPAAAAVGVPACPEWTVEDLLAHLTTIAVDWLATEEGRPSPGVSRGGGLPALLDQWDAAASRLEVLLAGSTGMHRAVVDAVAHEYDARVALGVGWPADDPVVPGVLESLGPALTWTVAERELPPLRVTSPYGSWLAGDGESAVVRAEAVPLMRSITGRRTHEQIASLDWSADPRTWLPAFEWGPFRPPSEPVE